MNAKELTAKWAVHIGKGWYGFQISDGWADLVDNALQQCCAAFDAHDVGREHFVIHQIKEKFGGLRLYWSHDLEDPLPQKLYVQLEQIVLAAEEKAQVVCEQCSNDNGVNMVSCGWSRAALCVSCEQLMRQKEKQEEGDDGH